MKTGKIVMITGCTRGLGRAMVDNFVERGDTVAGCARSQELLDEMREKFGEGHGFWNGDTSKDDDMAAFCHETITRFGVPDLVVNNAAIINRNAPLWEIGADDFSKLIDVNIKGVANVIRHIVPAMIEKGSGVIVNFSSYWGRSTSSEVAPYCASKFAIEGLTSALAQELPAGLATVAFNPGIIDTDMLRSTFGEGAGAHSAPSEWAKTSVPYLASLGAEDNGKSVTAPGQ